MAAYAVSAAHGNQTTDGPDARGRSAYPEDRPMGLRPQKTASELLDLYYHDMRSHLLEVAAALDRIDLAGGLQDARLERLRQAGEIALGRERDRAQRFLTLLSVD